MGSQTRVRKFCSKWEKSLLNPQPTQARKALRDVVETFPEYPGLHYQLEEAESLARAATWQPVSARQFLMLSLDSGKHFVANGKQLIETVLESLDRLNLKLHAELNPVKYLWVPSNEGSSRFQPIHGRSR
jgi:hypothetical protein